MSDSEANSTLAVTTKGAELSTCGSTARVHFASRTPNGGVLLQAKSCRRLERDLLQFRRSLDQVQLRSG